MKNKNNFRALVKRFPLGLFVFAFFLFLYTPDASAAVNTNSLVHAFRSYVASSSVITPVTQNNTIPPSALLPNQGAEKGDNSVSSIVTNPPVVYVSTPPSSVSESSVLSALRKILSKKEIADQLRGPTGPQGPAGPQGLSQPSTPNSVAYLPVRLANPDSSANNFPGGAYANIASLNSNIINATTTNVTTLNVAGATTLTGALTVGGTSIASSGALTGTTLALSGALTALSINGNTITTGTGTLTLGASKTLTVSDSTTLATNAITLGGGEVVTFSPTNALSLLTTAATSVTLPTTGTLATLAGIETLSNKTLTTPILGVATATSLAVNGATLGSNALAVTGMTAISSSASAASFIPTGSTVPTNGLYLPAANRVSLATNSTERMTIDSSGNVGIGTTSPSEKLQVAGNIIAQTSQNTYFTANATAANATASLYAQNTNNGNALSMETYGNSISGTLFGVTKAGASAIYVNSALITGTSAAQPYTFATNNSERMRIDSAGNVGIGITSPAQALEVSRNVAGSFTNSANIRLSYSAQPTVYYNEIQSSFNGNPATDKLNFFMAGGGGASINALTFTQDGTASFNGSDLFSATVSAGFRGSSTLGGSLGLTNSDWVSGSTGSGFRIYPSAVSGNTYYKIEGGTNGNSNSANIVINATGGLLGIRTTAPTAYLHLGAGTATASTAPLKFTSGSLNTTPEAGAVEFLTDAFYGTITTGAARKTFAFLESPSFTTPNIGAASGTSLALSGPLSGVTTLGASGVATLTNTTASTSTTTGALVVSGGVGIAKDSFINTLRIGLGSGSNADTVVVGSQGAGGNTTATRATIVGAGAGAGALTGAENTFVGFFAGTSDTSGTFNTFVGSQAGYTATTGARNTAVGYSALVAMTTASDNTAVGSSALAASTTGNKNVAVGSAAAAALTTATYDVALGYRALNANTTGNSNVAIGGDALLLNTTGAGNVAIGDSSLASVVTGNGNTAVGYATLYNNTAASNTAMGYNAMTNTTSGGSNTAIGVSSMYTNTTGSSNSAFGNSALFANTTGTDNVAVGLSALTANTTAIQNTAIGREALSTTQTGNRNTAVGYRSLSSSNGAAENTGVGWQAGYAVSSGNYNTYLGSQAGISATTGSNNVSIGYSAGAYSTTQSNELFIDNQSRTNRAGDIAGALLYGTFNSTVASQTLAINAATTVSSTTASTSSTTGALKVSGGLGVAGAINTGSSITVPAASGYLFVGGGSLKTDGSSIMTLSAPYQGFAFYSPQTGTNVLSTDNVTIYANLLLQTAAGGINFGAGTGANIRNTSNVLIFNAYDSYQFTTTGGTSTTVASINNAGMGTFTNLTNSGLTATRVTFAGTGGLLSDDADLTFATDTLSATKLLSSTSVSTPSLISTGAITMTPAAGSNLNVALSTTGDFAVNTNQLYVDTSAAAVGIGITTPVAPLHVVGASSQGIRISGAANARLTLVASNDSTNMWNFDNSAGTLRFFRENYSASGSGAGGSVKMSITDSGRVGIGTTATNILDIDDGGDETLVGIGGAGTSARLRIGWDRSGPDSGILSAQIAVDDSGNLVLGTRSNNTSGLMFYTYTGSAYGERGRFASGGNFGIGSTSPTAHLMIDGNISASSWTTDGIAFDSNAATYTDTSTAAAGTVAIRTANSFGAPTFASTNAITVTDAFTLYVPKPIAGTNTTITRANSAYFEGAVGIGTTTPGYKFDVKNDVASYVANFFNDGNNANRSGVLIQAGLDDDTAAGPSTLIAFKDGDGGDIGSITFGSSATAYNTTSDQRLKNLVNENTASSLNVLNQIKIHDFTWKNDANHNLYTGVFAQELYNVYPHAVTKPINDADKWMVDYSKLTPVMIASIQELDLNLNAIAGTITPLAGSTNESFVNAFFKNVYEKVDTWMADKANNIGDFFANKVHTKQICVAKSDGTEFCADGDKLEAMAAGSSSSVANNTGGSSSGSGGSSAGGTPPADPGTGGGATPGADTTPPVITLNGDSTMNLNVGETYSEQGATATDDVDTSVAVIISGTVDTNTAGTYTIHYNATDTAGNHAIEVTRTVNVNAPAPTAGP